MKFLALLVTFMFFNELTAFAQVKNSMPHTTETVVIALSVVVVSLIVLAFVYCSGYNEGYLKGKEEEKI